MPPNPELNAGVLDRRVTLLRPLYNAYQDEITGWEPVADVWASIAPNYGQEQTEAGRTVSTVQSPILIRHRSDIDARWRLRSRTSTYEVEAILNIQTRGAQLQLMCKEVL